MPTKAREFQTDWADHRFGNNHFPDYQWYISQFDRYPETLVLDFPVAANMLYELDAMGYTIIHRAYSAAKEDREPYIREATLLKDQTLVIVVLDKNGFLVYLKMLFKDIKDVQPIVNIFTGQAIMFSAGQVHIANYLHGSFDLKPSRIRKPLRDNELELHYGQGFNQVHAKTQAMLNDDKSRFALFYGKPGTGKTNYLRYLVNSVQKKYIFILSSFLKMMSAPDLTEFLFEHKQAVFIIEDAESVLMSRKANPNSPVNIFLNITDGFLSDVFQFKFIITVNGDVRQLDQALLRKGRLALSHEFNELNERESNALAKHLEIHHTFTGKNTLADIYNYQDGAFGQEKKVGF